MLLLVLSCTLLVTQAQESLGTLVAGQAVINDITSETPTLRYTYVLDQASTVTIQAFGQAVQPSVSISSEGTVIAAEPNIGGLFSVSLTTVLNAGTVTVDVSAVNGTTGSIATVIASATPITVTNLVAGSALSAQVSLETPVTFYRLTALDKPSSLSVMTGEPFGGADVRLFNETANLESGTMGTDLMGGIFYLAPNSFTYRLEVRYNGITPTVPFTVCWSAADSSGCNGNDLSAPATTAACSVSPVGSSVNVRSSASVSAPQIGTLASGSSAPVSGISTDGFFYNIQFNNQSGWVALSVVLSNGDCADVPVTAPPAFTPVATSVPTQAATAIPPTAVSTLPPTPGGPCLITLTSPTFVYTQPTAQIDFLQDQVQSGELIPVGKLADNTWWKTNYANAWVETSVFGVSATVSGNCNNLPVVSP